MSHFKIFLIYFNFNIKKNYKIKYYNKLFYSNPSLRK